VVAACDFAPNAGWNGDGPSAHDSARVPGGFGSLKGELFHDRNHNWTVDPGEAIVNTRIVLRDAELGTDVAEAFSDGKGDLRFPKVPAADYRAWIDGPWKFDGENGGHVRIFADVEGNVSFVVVPDARPATGGVTPPAPAAGGPGDALAKTGASVLGLGLIGALLVAFGLGASVIGRRRHAQLKIHLRGPHSR
jgi:hypothetical protein